METNQNQQEPENRPFVPGSGNNRDSETGRIESDPGTNTGNSGAASTRDDAEAASVAVGSGKSTSTRSGTDTETRSGADLNDANTLNMSSEVDETYDATLDDEEDFSDTSDDDLDDDNILDEDEEDEEDY